MNDFAHLYAAASRADFMVFLERCFATLEPGTVFQDNWHLHAIAEALRRVRSGETTRLIINVPPRSGKSIIVSIAFPAWLLGHDPRKRIICVSHSEDLARAHAAAFRSIVSSDWYRQLFPSFRLTRAGDRAVETITTERGFRYAVSISGSVLGRGADLIIGDDAMGPLGAISEAHRRRDLNLWDTAHRTRLNNKRTGAIILVSQRLHQDDLVGHAVKAGQWEVLSIPAICPEDRTYRIGQGPHRLYRRQAGEVLHPEREPREVLDEMRLAIGSMNFSAQYQQDPVPPDGNIIKREWLRYYEAMPTDFDRVVVSWDTASTIGEDSNYSVGTVWGAIGANYYLFDLVRGKFEVPDLRRRLLELSGQWHADATLIEDTELGRALQQDLARASQLRPLLRRARYDKEARLLAQSARFEAGHLSGDEKEAPRLLRVDLVPCQKFRERREQSLEIILSGEGCGLQGDKVCIVAQDKNAGSRAHGPLKYGFAIEAIAARKTRLVKPKCH